MQKFDEIELGKKFELHHKITQSDVDTFAQLTGDFNPLHVDQKFAQKTNFKKPVVHGMLSASFISTMVGMLIPGPGALWSSQTLEFLKPVFIGDTISVIAEVKQKSPATKSIKLDIIIINQFHHTVISGVAVVKLLELEKEKNMSLQNSAKKNIVITGAAKGIGAAIAKKMAPDFNLVLLYKSSSEQAHQLQKELSENGHEAICIETDLNRPEQICESLKLAREKFGPLTGLIHCAAPVPIPNLLQNLEWNEYENQLSTQVKSAFIMTKFLLNDMIEHKWGSLVFIGSIYAEGACPVQQSPYVVSKAALSAMARSFAVELGPHNIRVNLVSPGMTETDMIAAIPEKTKMLAKIQTPLRKLATPDDVAATVHFLMSESAGHITGENIKVCGGVNM